LEQNGEIEKKKENLLMQKIKKKHTKLLRKDNIINNPNPAWTKLPTELSDDYKTFYHELYPMQFEEPLFHIHLNVDYPFNLTGILYFPKLVLTYKFRKIKFNNKIRFM
jgi:molecular chaperone HtpG